MKARQRILILLASLISASCAIRKDLETPFNDAKNAPIVDGGGKTSATGTKYCKINADGKFDATGIILTNGMNSDGSAWGEGGGCVLKPIREVWAAMSNQPAMKWDEADSLTFTRTINPTADFTHLYTVTYAKSTLIGDINWTIEWFHGFDQGTFLAPLRVNISYGRISGTSNIPVWNGGVTITKISDAVTSVEIRNNFKARQSDSDNLASTETCISQIVNHARNAIADWASLNTGFKDNPSQPDPPPADDANAAGEYCLKDSSGNYPSTPTVDNESAEGVSVVTVRTCVPIAAAALYQKLQNPVSVIWNNAISGTTIQLPQDPSIRVVTYSAKPGFLRSVNQWTQDWTYTANAATAAAPENYLVAYKMDPSTSTYPVWRGSVAIIAIDANESAIEIQNNLLLDSVAASPTENKTVSQGLMNSLTAAPAAP